MCGSLSSGPDDVFDRWNRLFEVLSSEPRRRIIDGLLDVPTGDSIRLPEAAVDPNGGADLERLHLRLRHHHLPLLEAERIVQWEPEPLRAYRGCNFEDAGTVLRLLYANAAELPDRLVLGCRTLERKRGENELSG